MRSRRTHAAAWAVYIVAAIMHMVALATNTGALALVTKALLAPALIVAVLSALSLTHRMAKRLTFALALAFLADIAPGFTPWAHGATSVLFLLALVVYAATLAPYWLRELDGLHLLLAIPYGGVVIGLFLACAGGAGSLLPLLVVYALVLAAVAFLSAGVNPLTWIGGTLLLLSSSVLGMSWFLPGAWIPESDLWVMGSYIAGNALLVLGLLRTVPARRWAPQPSSGASLVIIEG
ncbi:lysoplasmalogenase family protein [Brachybacterium subflavum]|uniref:lysoplasmalogenase family protein n=1 Tax=Brachybacterium subflavum TaxID=2585206 RepID=UPI001D0D7992|nr:lysoplasmalogenase family protein [Brachybacterium subflavum]